MPLGLCSQAGKVFWMQQNLLQNGPFPECQRRATAAKGWDPVGKGHAYSSSWFWKNKGGRKEPWNHKKGKINSWV